MEYGIGERFAGVTLSSIILGAFSIVFFSKITPLLPFKPIIPALELLLVATPLFFVFTYSYDAVLGGYAGFVYSGIKEAGMAWLLGTPFRPMDIIIFTLAFFIFSLGIAFSRETSLEKARIGGVAILSVFITFIFSSFILTIYTTQFASQAPAGELPFQLPGKEAVKSILFFFFPS